MSKRLQFTTYLLSLGLFACLLWGCLGPTERAREGRALKCCFTGPEFRHGAVIRGSCDGRRLALAFTGHEFAEGGETVLNELSRHQAKASFFLTGDFLRNGSFAGLIERLAREGHQLGPHSDKHLLYCSWEGEKRTLVSRKQFEDDLRRNYGELRKHLVVAPVRCLLPPYEHYNQQIADWAQALGFILVNFTPGTRSTADYTREGDVNFVSSAEILKSILGKEQQDPNGLNGYILLLHLGAGPGRVDKFHTRFGELLDYLSAKGYEFVTVADLLPPGGAGAP